MVRRTRASPRLLTKSGLHPLDVSSLFYTGLGGLVDDLDLKNLVEAMLTGVLCEIAWLPKGALWTPDKYQGLRLDFRPGLFQRIQQLLFRLTLSGCLGFLLRISLLTSAVAQRRTRWHLPVLQRCRHQNQASLHPPRASCGLKDLQKMDPLATKVTRWVVERIWRMHVGRRL